MHARHLLRIQLCLLCLQLVLAACAGSYGTASENQQSVIAATRLPTNTNPVLPTARSSIAITAQNEINPILAPSDASGVITPTQPSALQAAANVIADADWPQLGRDPQHSNASPQSITGPYRFYWRWMDVPFASRIQPVVAEGRLLIGDLTGVMYALDAAYDSQAGKPRILWQHALGSPIRAGAGVAGDIVVVGTQHGTIYGLAATTGQQRWSIATGGAIIAAPLISAGIAYLGSANGSFYAIRLSDGAILWQRSVGVPILGSAALSEDGSRIFFMGEKIVAYALDTLNGTQLWQAQLQGQSGADRWPVVLGDLVVFRTMPLGYFHNLLHDGDQVMDSAGPVRSEWASDWAAIQPTITQHLAAHPAEQTFFALDAATGQSRGIAPVLYTFGNNDAPAPPLVYQQALYLTYRARHGIQTDSGSIHVTTRYDAELGRMEPGNLNNITGLKNSGNFDYEFRLTSDEPAILSAAGDLLLVDNWERLGGIRLSDGGIVGIAEVGHDFPECQGPCEANDYLMPFYEQYPFPGPRAGEGHARGGAIVASGRIFWRVLENGLAAIGPATPGQPLPHPTVARPHSESDSASATAQLPLPHMVSPEILRDIIWDEPNIPSAVPADLHRRLEQEIQRIVESNQHLMPFYLERGFHGQGSWPPDTSNSPEPAIVADSRSYWFAPSELIMTLSMSYPYLNPTTQAQVRTYLQEEMAHFPPLEALPFPPTTWLSEGRAREPYPVTTRSPSWSVWPPPGVPIQTLYALWAYARYTDDWAYISAHWDAIQALFLEKKGAIDTYAEIAGAIGYARLAQHLGYTAAAHEGEMATIAAMQAGLNFTQWRDHANTLYPDPRDLLEGQRAPVFFGMTPEIGRYLRETNLAAVDASLTDVISYPNRNYLWYVTRLGIQSERGESSYHTPELAWSVFLTQAYIRQVGQAQLRYWLDRPWGVGDVWYLQKLIATIGRPSPSTPTVMTYVPLVQSP